MQLFKSVLLLVSLDAPHAYALRASLYGRRYGHAQAAPRAPEKARRADTVVLVRSGREPLVLEHLAAYDCAA
jgi:hypothetical protein